MAWKPNRKLIELGHEDLEYVPRGASGWDATLACMSYGLRMAVDGRAPDLNSWAARHAAHASARYAELGDRALVLWHGTSRERAEKIARHGLFHRRGVWAARHPGVPHSFCRTRSAQAEACATTRPADPFAGEGFEGAVVCILLDRSELVEGRDYEAESGNVFRFQHALPAEAIEYVLDSDAVRFTGRTRSTRPAPWPVGRFRKSDGRWRPVRKPPVPYEYGTPPGGSRARVCGPGSAEPGSRAEDDGPAVPPGATYSTPIELAALCLARLLGELGGVTALELFATVYSCVEPREAVAHADLLGLLDRTCAPFRHRRGMRLFRARE
jgi:hypothetical protein